MTRGVHRGDAAGWRAWRADDAAEWNAFVDEARYGAFTQLWEWGELRRAAGWTPIRLAVAPRGSDRPAAGVQLLLRRIPAIGWQLAYAPRGPIGEIDDPAALTAVMDAVREIGRTERIATLRADPEVTAADPAGERLLAPPWRAADKVQPPITRIIDLERPEEELRAEMRAKHRQYVSKAERSGIVVEQVDPTADTAAVGAALADFNRIYQLTARRAGFVARDPAYYDRVWRIFGPTGRVRLWFASRDGERVATLFHFTCGRRAVESYGGMTPEGAESRANYLLKWRAITGFKAEGFGVYDLWGLATGGIAQFKEGFGGRQVEYVGARDLPLRAPVDVLLRAAIPAYGAAQRLRLRLKGRGAAPAGSPLD